VKFRFFKWLQNIARNKQKLRGARALMIDAKTIVAASGRKFVLKAFMQWRASITSMVRDEEVMLCCRCGCFHSSFFFFHITFYFVAKMLFQIFEQMTHIYTYTCKKKDKDYGERASSNAISEGIGECKGVGQAILFTPIRAGQVG
jgi:hypothetical protein